MTCYLNTSFLLGFLTGRQCREMALQEGSGFLLPGFKAWPHCHFLAIWSLAFMSLFAKYGLDWEGIHTTKPNPVPITFLTDICKCSLYGYFSCAMYQFLMSYLFQFGSFFVDKKENKLLPCIVTCTIFPKWFHPLFSVSSQTWAFSPPALQRLAHA